MGRIKEMSGNHDTTIAATKRPTDTRKRRERTQKQHFPDGKDM